ncbi:hypothetical protein EYZ11_000114 [Aspergillus tanneri]|uniref:DJ-1/PfpI domain-containing protein n=1 Tax=Aspergillus tanneri TaxID=1220188 RepID=A0A4S3JXV4_9EURO|nr:uncharacterized protein ATNIH1004_005706 [Aspergillus tanneri]KAA8647023.1 hypothetical protein ATNIH1004_005706 [Aspergillus tanneri]THD00387.1 hypothetical protein EYZ11_000114 [Aspergillus tanneri]
MRNTKSLLRIGVMLESVQLLDIAGIDIFGNLGKDYLTSVQSMMPQAAQYLDIAPKIEWHYVSSTMEPMTLTPSTKIIPTETYDDCPRDLDIVLTGGPLVSVRPEAADRYMKEAWETTRVWMTTCVGAMWLADSGVLDGHNATTNRGVLPAAKKLHPKVNWLDQRWVIDEKPYAGEGKGELWTGGGAGAGLDMIGTYVLNNFNQSFVNSMSLLPLQMGPDIEKGQFYTN